MRRKGRGTQKRKMNNKKKGKGKRKERTWEMGWWWSCYDPCMGIDDWCKGSIMAEKAGSVSVGWAKVCVWCSQALIVIIN